MPPLDSLRVLQHLRAAVVITPPRGVTPHLRMSTGMWPTLASALSAEASRNGRNWPPSCARRPSSAGPRHCQQASARRVPAYCTAAAASDAVPHGRQAVLGSIAVLGGPRAFTAGGAQTPRRTLVVASTSAPCSSKRRTIPAWPSSQASISAVFPSCGFANANAGQSSLLARCPPSSGNANSRIQNFDSSGNSHASKLPNSAN